MNTIGTMFILGGISHNNNAPTHLQMHTNCYRQCPIPPLIVVVIEYVCTVEPLSTGRLRAGN